MLYAWYVLGFQVKNCYLFHSKFLRQYDRIPKVQRHWCQLNYILAVLR